MFYGKQPITMKPAQVNQMKLASMSLFLLITDVA